MGPELPISAHVACARVCWQLYVLCSSHALVQATVGVGAVIIVYIGVAYTGGGGTKSHIVGNTKTQKYIKGPNERLVSIYALQMLLEWF